jgi:NAD(P)-dependent dehydrogenase (short-subunit alcohol dehydrogenase family)
LGVNIADETSVQAGFKSVMKEFGQVDSVVNSAVCLTSWYTTKKPMHPNLI